MENKLIQNFKDNKELYDSFRERIVNLLEDLLDNSRIVIHQISSRTKTFDSLSNKIVKKDKYTDLNQITDVVGIRLITYLDSDVDKVEELVRKEFEIDTENSIDKRQLQINEFGYRSLHLVASLDANRIKLTEYLRYNGLKFEIQIRSILQHAWAEIEHDLGYKGKSAIPDSYRRNFNRLSALLESADIEFDRLKNDLTQYEQKVSDEIITAPQKVPINQASIASLIKTNPTFEEARNYVVNECNAYFDQPANYDGLIDKFTLFEIDNIGELQKSIEDNKAHFIRFVKDFIKPDITKHLSNSLPLFWYQHFLASKTQNSDFIKKYLSYKGDNIIAKPKEFIDRYNRTLNHS